MKTILTLEMLPQPTVDTCGPTCLHAVYRYYGDHAQLADVIAQVPALEGGGTLAVNLGCHALRRGYESTIYTLNLQVFDPSWFGDEPVDLTAKLLAQRAVKTKPKLRLAIDHYLEYLALGGRVEMRSFTADLVRRILRRKTPILAGLSATWLYRSPREHGPQCEYDDVRGVPSGHFVVMSGYDAATREVQVADPYLPNPLGEQHHYGVDIQHAISAIHLGILTYDANLLVVQPAREDPRRRR